MGQAFTSLTELELADAHLALSLIPKGVSLVDCAKHWAESHEGESITINDFMTDGFSGAGMRVSRKEASRNGENERYLSGKNSAIGRFAQ